MHRLQILRHQVRIPARHPRARWGGKVDECKLTGMAAPPHPPCPPPPVINTPPPSGKPVKSVADFLRVSGKWHNNHSEPDTGMLSNLWYRGVSESFDCQAPGVYRKDFTERAGKLKIKGDLEAKRLRLERDMLSNFRTAGAAFLSNYSETEMYFWAQHRGMPTRLLDWSANPLAALFFACENHEDKDGFVYAMDSRHVIPDHARRSNIQKLWPSVLLMRDSIVESAVGVSFWRPGDPYQKPYVLPSARTWSPVELVSKVPASHSTCTARHPLIIQR
jgi:hypothetical protein